MRPGAQTLEAHQHTFCSHLKTHFKHNFDQSMLKNAYFFEKDVKNCKSIGGSALPTPPNPVGLRRLENPTPDLRVVTSAYYYNFVKFISSIKFGLLPSKKKKFCIFQIFAVIFHFKLCNFFDRRRKNISCPRAQGTLAIRHCILSLVFFRKVSVLIDIISSLLLKYRLPTSD